MKIVALVSAALATLLLSACSEVAEGAFDSRSEPQLRYLEGCSRLSITDTSTYNLAVANCLGRVRGFVDGHVVTMEMVETDDSPMWCVSPSVSDGEIMESVLNTVDQIADAAKGRIPTNHSSIVAITILAVSSHYSCSGENNR